MAWIQIDDHFDEHPKLLKVGPLGWGVWLAGLAYCNRNLTDGFIPWTKARTLVSFDVVEDDGKLWQLCRGSNMDGRDIDADWVIGLLIDAGLWDEVTNGRGRIDGYQVHDYTDWQRGKEEIQALRGKRAEAGRAGGLAKSQASANQVLEQTANKSQAKEKQNSTHIRTHNKNPTEEAPGEELHQEEGSLTRVGDFDRPSEPDPPPSSALAVKQGPKRITYSQDFSDWWKAYPPGHGTKKEAWDAWQVLRPDLPMIVAMMVGLEAWKASERWQEGFIVDAVRFIRKRYWEDQPPPPKPAVLQGKAAAVKRQDERLAAIMKGEQT